MNKKVKAMLYFEDLRKLIKQCPKGYKLAYDIDKGLFMTPENSDFNHETSSGAPAILCSVGMSYNSHKSDEDGYMTIVANVIGQEYIDLAACSSNAEIYE